MSQKFVLHAECGYFGFSGQGLGGAQMPPISARCSCGVKDLKKPHSPTCTFGKPLSEVKNGRV